MKLLEIYKQQIFALNYEYDEKQVEILVDFQNLSDNLIRKYNITKRSFKNKFLSFFNKHNNISGIYLWGGVGLGKTFLVDLFYNNLNIDNKKRIHFHLHSG